MSNQNARLPDRPDPGLFDVRIVEALAHAVRKDDLDGLPRDFADLVGGLEQVREPTRFSKQRTSCAAGPVKALLGPAQ